MIGPLAHPFFDNALLAGTAIAAASGLVGYFLVPRAQVFTGDALSHVAFTGALAALALGVDLLAAPAGTARQLTCGVPEGGPASNLRRQARSTDAA